MKEILQLRSRVSLWLYSATALFLSFSIDGTAKVGAWEISLVPCDAVDSGLKYFVVRSTAEGPPRLNSEGVDVRIHSDASEPSSNAL
jgi:hypothetical protein